MNKRVALIILVAAIVGAIWYLEGIKAGPNSGESAVDPQSINIFSATGNSSTASSGEEQKNAISAGTLEALKKIAAADMKAGYQPAIEIARPTGFINASDTLTLKSLIGKKVILVDFWTYSCINCIRTLPYLTSWYKKYKDQGLEIVGVHTPEFDFEKDINNVRMATQKYGIEYPVVLDSNNGTWNAYGNLYWPHEYLIDIAGYIVHDHIGEGDYDKTESEIMKLLAQRSTVLGAPAPVASKTEIKPASLYGIGSPETYFGSNRNEYFANGIRGQLGPQTLVEPEKIESNKLYLAGQWNITPEYAETGKSVGLPQTGSDKIDYRYFAKGVYLVAGTSGGSIDVEVTRDGKPLDSSVKGADIFYQNGRSYVRVKENRLYRIIDEDSAGNHLLEFIISSPGFQAYTFTFG